MALGELGWTPYEYYTSSPHEFYCACEGYFNKVNTEAGLHRANAFIVYRALGGKENMDKIWPLRSDKKRQVEKMVMTPEMYAKIKKAHNLK